jgi:predicted kinase
MPPPRLTDPTSEVVLMCGIAGSGKTTYAQDLERHGFRRLSVDEEVWRRFGQHGVDFPASDYDRLSALAEADLQTRLLTFLAQGQNVVIDLSFWQRAARDRYKRLIEQAGGTWRLVYLKVEPGELRRRLAHRRARVDANAAFPITDEILDHYLTSFEEPRGEGEEIVLQADQVKGATGRRDAGTMQEG